MKKPSPPGMRPIGARALKSATDSLRPWLAGARVLDLFSGQGRFGLSALEEEAAHVVFVEKDPRLARAIEKATQTFAARREVAREDVFHFLARPDQKFDIVFADPPFACWKDDFHDRLFSQVAATAVQGSIFLVKHPSRVVPSDRFFGYSPWKSSPFGESRLL